MKKILSLLLVCFLSLFTLFFFSNAQAEEGTEVDANIAATNLFTSFYNEGNYKKDTLINVNDEVLDEIENCFHSKVTTLERTTYYQGDKLWMSNSKGYSGYGTLDGVLTSFKVTRQHEEETATKTTIEGGMEGYYCTLNDFKEGTHNSGHVKSEITLNTGWEYIDGVLASRSEDVLEGFRLFTAPLWLNNYETSNYVTFALATIEEEELDNKEGAKNLTRLVMKLWADTIDSNKVNNDETISLDGKTYYLFSKAEVYKDFTLAFEGNGTKNDPYLIQSDEDWITFGEHGADKYKFSGEYVKLAANVNVSKSIFKGINYAFRGTLDGAGNKVVANIDSTSARTGVFSYLGGSGVIKNLTVEGSIKGGLRTGGLVALCYGVVDNCVNNAAVTSDSVAYVQEDVLDVDGNPTYDESGNKITQNSSEYDYEKGGILGGLIGYLCEDAKVLNSTNNGNVTGVVRVGGVVGFAAKGDEETETVVSNCENNGTIKGENSVGGVIGVANATKSINGNKNTGTVIGIKAKSGLGIGGIVGNSVANAGAIIITNCENSGTVNFNVDNSFNAAGIIGVVAESKEYSEINGCINSGNITAGRYVAGIVANNYGSVILNSSNSGKIYGVNGDGGNFYLGGICGRSYSSFTVTKEFNIRVYTSKSEYTEISKELTGTIVNCSNSGKIYANAEYATQYLIGGIIGSLNSSSSTGIVTACYNSAEVIGTGKTAGIIGYASASTPAMSSQYCYQLGANVKNLDGKVQTGRWSSKDAGVCLYIGKSGTADSSKICVDLISSTSRQPNEEELMAGKCAYYK